METNMVVPQKNKYRISMWSTNSTCGYILKKKMKARIQSDICALILSQFLLPKKWELKEMNQLNFFLVPAHLDSFNNHYRQIVIQG